MTGPLRRHDERKNGCVEKNFGRNGVVEHVWWVICGGDCLVELMWWTTALLNFVLRKLFDGNAWCC